MRHMPADAPLDWDAALARAGEVTGCVALIGPIDTGKSTFALALANRAAAAGRPVSVVDGDLGQSEIGPPATVGLATLDGPVGSLGELHPRGLAFVGDISPVGHLLPVIGGTLAMARRAADLGAELTVLDTSGLVHGRLGEKLKLAKLAALRPALTLVFERPGEMARLRRLLACVLEGEIASVTPPPEVRRKSPVFRRGRRERQWARYFHKAATHELTAAQVDVVDAWPFTGRPLPPHHLKFASEALGTTVVHAEESPDGLAFCTDRPVGRRSFAVLEEQFGRQRMLATPGDWFQHLAVGLIGDGGRTLAAGLLQGIHFGRGLFAVLTPLASVATVRQIHFGRVRVRPDGAELGRLPVSAM